MLFAILVVCFAVFNSHAQNDEAGGMIKTAKGILIVWNEPSNNYTIEIKGDAIHPAQGGRMLFSVDRKFLQVLTVPKSDILKNARKDELDKRAVLTAHRDWEAKYLENTLNEPLKIESSWQKLASGEEALVWSFDMPKRLGSDARKQVFLTVPKDNHVLILNGAVTDKTDEKTVNQFLIETVSTLRTSTKPFSMKKLQEQIMKGN